jgi:mevalonate pyrophosphate decarboxylase
VTRYILIAALVLAGCSKKKQEEAPAPTPVATSGSGSAAGSATGSATAAAGSAVDVPTEQDFEEQAKADIDDKNVGKKLEALESQLGGQ